MQPLFPSNGHTLLHSFHYLLSTPEIGKMSAERPQVLRVILEIISPIIPLFVIAEVLVLGFVPTLWQMFRHPRWIMNASCWRDSFIHTAQPSLMAMADK